MCDFGPLGPSRVKVHLIALGTTLFMTLQKSGDKPAYSKPDLSGCFPPLKIYAERLFTVLCLSFYVICFVL